MKGKTPSPTVALAQRSTRSLFASVTLVALCATAACDARDPTSPAVRVPAPIHRQVSTPVLVGSSSIPISNQWADVDWTSISAPISPANWVRVHVEGTVHLGNNPAYDASVCTPGLSVTCHPPSPLVGRDIGPLGVADPSLGNPDYAVLVVYAMIDRPVPDLLYSVDRRGDGQSWDAIEWVPRGAPGVQMYRSGNHRGFFGTPAYIFSGSQTLTVEVVPPPATIEASAGAGTATHFTFAPMEPYGAYGLEWYFVGQDTAAEPNFNFGAFLSGIGLPATHILGCDGALTCDYAVPKAGRVYVKSGLTMGGAYVTHPGYFASAVTGRQAPQLKLACSPTPTVPRGDSIACVVSPQPTNGSVSNLAWTFVDSAGHQVPGPAVANWGGRLVVSGMMRVTGTVNGNPAADSLRISVTRRRWPRITLRVKEDGHGDLPPDSQAHSSGDLAHTHVSRKAPHPFVVEELTAGPNAGWGFMSAPLDTLEIVVHISDAWKHGSAWYNLQRSGTWTDHVTGATEPYCTKGQLSLLLRLAREHEGSLSSALTSHVDVFQDWFKNNSPQDSLEAVVLYKPDLPAGVGVRDWILNTSYAQFVESPANQDPNQRHKNATPPGFVDLAPFPCRMRFFP